MKSLGWRLQGDQAVSTTAVSSPTVRSRRIRRQPQPNYVWPNSTSTFYRLTTARKWNSSRRPPSTARRSGHWMGTTLRSSAICPASSISGLSRCETETRAHQSLLRRDIGDVWPVGMTRAGSYYYVYEQPGVEQVSDRRVAFPMAVASDVRLSLASIRPGLQMAGLSRFRGTAGTRGISLFARSERTMSGFTHARDFGRVLPDGSRTVVGAAGRRPGWSEGLDGSRHRSWGVQRSVGV